MISKSFSDLRRQFCAGDALYSLRIVTTYSFVLRIEIEPMNLSFFFVGNEKNVVENLILWQKKKNCSGKD